LGALTLPGGDFSFSADFINNAGDVAGFSSSQWKTAHPLDSYFSNGQMTDIWSLAGGFSQIFGSERKRTCGRRVFRRRVPAVKSVSLRRDGA
jgi:hypothetical protein